MDGKVTATKDAHVLISETCEYLTLHGKWDSPNVILVKDVVMGRYPVLSTWVQCNHKDPYERYCGDVKTGTEVCIQ